MKVPTTVKNCRHNGNQDIYGGEIFVCVWLSLFLYKMPLYSHFHSICRLWNAITFNYISIPYRLHGRLALLKVNIDVNITAEQA
jgi:hypothetical protein